MTITRTTYYVLFNYILFNYIVPKSLTLFQEVYLYEAEEVENKYVVVMIVVAKGSVVLLQNCLHSVRGNAFSSDPN